MKGSATVDAQPNVCPKCQGSLFPDLDGDLQCLQCGYIAYARLPDPAPAKRERPPSYKGIKL
jgi:ribosomal protein S27AE